MKATLSDEVAVVCMTNQICAGWGELASRDTNEELEEPQEIQCYKAEAAIEPQINTNVESFLLVFLFVFINCFVSRDHRQITLIMLNRFSLLRKTPHPLFLMYNIKLDTCQFYIVFPVSKVLLIKSFCLVLLKLLHQKISFFTTFFNVIKHCLKKVQTPHPLNG